MEQKVTVRGAIASLKWLDCQDVRPCGKRFHFHEGRRRPSDRRKMSTGERLTVDRRPFAEMLWFV
jgi:hypothetical protein